MAAMVGLFMVIGEMKICSMIKKGNSIRADAIKVAKEKLKRWVAGLFVNKAVYSAQPIIDMRTSKSPGLKVKVFSVCKLPWVIIKSMPVIAIKMAMNWPVVGRSLWIK